MTVSFMSVTFSSCSGKDGEIDPPGKCSTTPQNILRMCDGIAFNFAHKGDIKYFYYDTFTRDEYSKMSFDEVVRKVDTGNTDDRVLPDIDNYACTYHCRPNTEYIIVTVSYGNDGKRGETIITETRTKTQTNQPLADLTDVGYDDDFENYIWQARRNDYCSQYFTYACVSKNVFPTYLYMYDEATPLMAWAIKEEMKRSKLDHVCSINNLGTSGIERFYASKSNDGTSKLEANILSDNYLQIVTWGADANGELSGLLGGGSFDFTASETKSQSDNKAVFKVPVKRNSQPKDDCLKKALLNSRDIQVFRVK